MRERERGGKREYFAEMVASVVVDLKIAAGGGQRWCWGGADGGGVGRLGFGGGLL